MNEELRKYDFVIEKIKEITSNQITIEEQLRLLEIERCKYIKPIGLDNSSAIRSERGIFG